MVPQGSTTVPASSSTDGAASPRRASDNRRVRSFLVFFKNLGGSQLLGFLAMSPK